MVARNGSAALEPAPDAGADPDRTPADGPADRQLIRLLIVDSHPLTRWALAHLAERESGLMTVGDVADPSVALDLATSLRADVVTVDCTRGDGKGWQLARDLRDRHPDLGIVILTADGSDDVLFRALDTGASAFVSKAAPVREIIAAIRHAAVAASSFSAAGLAQAMRRRHAPAGGLALSTRERQVLRLLREGHSVPEVAATLFVSLSTAKTYVARIYDKLGASNRAQALMTAVRLGMFEDSADALVS